jgi:hypothetical protein
MIASSHLLWPWLLLALLGAYHGLNPGMGWLFALSLGLQEKSKSAVLAALAPIALGHAAAIATAVLVLDFAGHFFPTHALKWPIAAIIAAVGIYRLIRARHPRGSGMRVTRTHLITWSFLMASAHGAGLMLAPLLLTHPTMTATQVTAVATTPTSRAAISSAGLWPAVARASSPRTLPQQQPPMNHPMPMPPSFPQPSITTALLITLVHTAAMLLVAGSLALLFFHFYEKSSLLLLRHLWINFDLLWAIALLLASVAILL